MFTQILWTQFKWTRAMLAICAVVTFSLPALAWRIGDAGMNAPGPVAVMRGMSALGPVLMMTAILIGFLLVAHIWNIDGAAKHVYALSLPLPWRRYVAMRFGAGALALLVPTLALWLGCLLALALIELPATLHAYPGALAFRFLLGALLAYSLSFLLQYAAGRRAPVVLLAILVGVLLTATLMSTFGYTKTLAWITHVLTDWPGPLAIYVNEWKLIDV